MTTGQRTHVWVAGVAAVGVAALVAGAAVPALALTSELRAPPSLPLSVGSPRPVLVQDVALRSLRTVRTHADTTNRGRSLKASAITTGNARAAVREVVDRRVLQESRRDAGCAGGPCTQQVAVDNDVVVLSRATSRNSGLAERASRIVTGAALSNAQVHQRDSSSQTMLGERTCVHWGCRQQLRLGNVAAVRLQADATNAGAAAPGAAIRTGAAKSAAVLRQGAWSAQRLTGCTVGACDAFARLHNALTVSVAEREGQRGVQASPTGRLGKPRANLDVVQRLEAIQTSSHLSARTVMRRNASGLLELADQRLVQHGVYNHVRTVVRQRLVIAGGHVLRGCSETTTSAHVGNRLPPGTHLGTMREQRLRRDEAHGTRGRPSASQQARVAVEQVGVLNDAEIVVEQMVVLVQGRPGAGAATAVSSAAKAWRQSVVQDVRQLGGHSRLHMVYRRRMILAPSGALGRSTVSASCGAGAGPGHVVTWPPFAAGRHLAGLRAPARRGDGIFASRVSERLAGPRRARD